MYFIRSFSCSPAFLDRKRLDCGGTNLEASHQDSRLECWALSFATASEYWTGATLARGYRGGL
jgi:hypothetical protein